MTNAISFAAPAISVDEENRAQAGDELYMAFFRPVRADYWQGNLKRFKIAWNATKETIVDQFGNDVTSTDGSFIASSSSFGLLKAMEDKSTKEALAESCMTKSQRTSHQATTTTECSIRIKTDY